MFLILKGSIWAYKERGITPMSENRHSLVIPNIKSKVFSNLCAKT
jgi:hypothetical protein